MKSEVLKFAFDCYTRGQHQSVTDDKVSYTPKQQGTDSLSGNPGTSGDGVLADVAYAVPEAYEPHHAPLEPHEEALARNLGRQLSEFSDDFELFSNTRQSVSDEQPLVHFKTACKFVKSTDGYVEIAIVRSGHSASQLTVAWRTRDNTARAGVHYVKAEGTVSFLPHETQKTIHVQLLSGHEDNYINFRIHLYDSRFIGPPETVNVNINDFKNLSRQEQFTIRSIIGDRIPSISHLIDKLSENVTANTFKTAMLYACGNMNSFPGELRAAFDLLRFALPHTSCENLMPFVAQYFENASELDERNIVLEDSDSDISESSNSDID